MMVILWDSLKEASNNREQFVEQISNEFDGLFIQTKNPEVLGEADVILVHDTFEENIDEQIWQLHYSLGASVKPISSDREGDISFELINRNLKDFLNHIREKDELTKEDFNILYGYDSELEASIELWKSLTLLGIKIPKENIGEVEYKKETKEILSDKAQAIDAEELPPFDQVENYNSDMKDLYKQLFPQN